MKLLLPAILTFAVVIQPARGTPYFLDASHTEERSTSPLPGMGGVAKDGTHYGVDGEKWLRNGQPWFPISGEMHYCRYPAAEWAQELAKMKALGVSIVSTYSIWNHHESGPGEWNWSGDRDLRKFLELAQQQGMLVWLRIGPYANAEAVNGGVPGFAMKNSRTNDPGYLAHVERYFTELAKQIRGMTVKDGGPIVGIQLENEFAKGHDPAHITKLKEMIIAKGVEAPYWSITGNTVCPRMTAIPLQGSYTYRGWEGNGGTGVTSGFSFASDEWTANTDLGGTYYDTKDYPRGYCELGTGSPMRDNSRFTVEPEFVLAQAYDCVGRGTNFLGYYMFHGGTQIPGLNGGGWPLTYDFQAPLGEFGQFRESAHQYRRLHNFVTEFTPELAVARVVRDPAENIAPTQTDRLRHIGRFHDGHGFWFVNNTQRNLKLPERKDVQVSIRTGDRTLTLPSEPLTMPERRFNVFPVRLDLGGIELTWASVEPLGRLPGADGIPCTVFWMPDWTNRELCFPADVKISIESGVAEIKQQDGHALVHAKSANERVQLLVQSAGKKARVLLITDADSRAALFAPVGGVKRLLILNHGEFTAVLPSLRMQGNAGTTMELLVWPVNHLKAPAGWTAGSTTGEWASFGATLNAAPPAPKLESAGGGVWRLKGRSADFAGLSQAQLVIPFKGDAAGIYAGQRAITFEYQHGLPWTVDLRRFGAALDAGELNLHFNGDPIDPSAIQWHPAREISFSP